MKLYFCLVLLCILKKTSSCFDFNITLRCNLPEPTPECITPAQQDRAFKTACAQKQNTVLWQKIIDCHIPMTELFMRTSGVGKCPLSKNYVDPANPLNSMLSVFLNACTYVEGTPFEIANANACFVCGVPLRGIMPTRMESAIAKTLFGSDILCRIGKCLLGLGLGA